MNSYFLERFVAPLRHEGSVFSYFRIVELLFDDVNPHGAVHVDENIIRRGIAPRRMIVAACMRLGCNSVVSFRKGMSRKSYLEADQVQDEVDESGQHGGNRSG